MYFIGINNAKSVSIMSKSLITLLKNKSALKYGNFTLRSGIKTTYYCDIKEVLGDSQVLGIIVKKLLKEVPMDATCIAGSGVGGIALASLVAYKKKLPLTLVRDKTKSHGMKKVVDGYIPTAKDRVCIVDDVFTTGGSIRNTKDKLRKTRAKFTKPVVVLNRSSSKSVLSILNAQEIT